MTSYRTLVSGVALGMALSGAAMAQTNVLPPASPQGTTAPNAGTTASPNGDGLAQGVVPPPRNVDPGMVTPPPANVKPSMPVIKPPPTAR